MSILHRTDDDNNWIVVYDAPHQSLKYYNYDRSVGKADFMLSTKPKLDEVQLANTYPLEIESRDGYKLVSYLTIPSTLDKDGLTTAPTPMVLLVHGGPWARDTYGFPGNSPMDGQPGLCNTECEFPGFYGFGKEFINIAAK